MRLVYLPVCSLLACVTTIGCGAAPVSRVQTAPAARLDGPSRAQAAELATAMERRLTVWTRPDGTPVFARSCRDAPGGCQARLRAFARMIIASAERHGIDPFLLAGLAMRESSFDPSAIGGVGEAGIVQLHPRGEGHDIRYVRDAAYRRRCLRRTDACQAPVVERAAEALARSERRCGSLTSALARYATGRCGRGLTHALRVIEERDRLLAALRGEGRRRVASR